MFSLCCIFYPIFFIFLFLSSKSGSYSVFLFFSVSLFCWPFQCCISLAFFSILLSFINIPLFSSSSLGKKEGLSPSKYPALPHPWHFSFPLSSYRCRFPIRMVVLDLKTSVCSMICFMTSSTFDIENPFFSVLCFEILVSVYLRGNVGK